MFVISAVALSEHVRSMPSAALLELRDRDGGLERTVTRHEAEVLIEGCAEGVANKRGFRYLRLTVDPRKAHGLLRRRMSSSGRTIAEDCQAVSRTMVAGVREGARVGGLVFTHIHFEAFSPAARAACR